MRAGLLMRVSALKDALGALDAVPVRTHETIIAGAVAQVDDGDTQWWLAILPGGQGNLVQAGTAVQIISPQAPMARVLLGLEEDDVAELHRPSGEVELEVLTVV